MKRTVSRREISDLLKPTEKPAKSYTQLLVEGVKHKGGLAQLAYAETMENPPHSIAALQNHSAKIYLKELGLTPKDLLILGSGQKH